ncbi:hypothetical protein [uncultured Flavonifractor sp.]|uniref:Uncharacterized protein n=1 Tax=Candidatus Flavonifractor intestinigallinarum TaxID=2838586 RepID=A0A9D2MMH7_9FIRM|nr:hypothetical protein [uncultured Flavonifractor sp.]HJB80431.1 hypothetical protein [Candidatus Flavonifractor intestinigallinarum]
MAQLEEQLNQILGNPQAMEQIMALAQSLSGKQEEERQPEEETQPPAENDPPSPLSALDGLDPRLLRMGMGLLSEYSAQDDKKTALLAALKPFLKPERQEKMDQAVRIARLTRVIRTALRMFRDRGEEEDDV